MAQLFMINLILEKEFFTMKLGNVFILGDSYSTYDGFVPDGYKSFYVKAGWNYTDVRSVNQVWWYKLITATNSKIILNSSYSGATICYTGYDGENYSEISLTGRLNALIENNFFLDNQIDTAFIFGGTNDDWAGAPIGDLKYENWSEYDLFYLAPAVCYLLSRAVKSLKNSKIYFILNSNLSAQVESTLIKACQHYNINIIKLSNIEKISGHPTIKGMDDICQQIYNYITEQEKTI